MGPIRAVCNFAGSGAVSGTVYFEQIKFRPLLWTSSELLMVLTNARLSSGSSVNLREIDKNGIVDPREKVVIITGIIKGLTQGDHALQVHEYGDFTNGCKRTGGIYNPFGVDHGAPRDKVRHDGDLGNVVAGEDGTASFRIEDKVISLTGPRSIIGRSMVIYADSDDFGRGGNAFSKTTGNPGHPLACGVIGRVKKTCGHKKSLTPIQWNLLK